MDPEILAAEVQRLQQCVNDLVSVLSVPAMWLGREPSEIVRSILDSFLDLLRLDLVYLSLNHPIGDAPTEMVSVLETLRPVVEPEQVRGIFNSWVKVGFMEWPERLTIGAADFGVVPFRLGLRGDIGFLVTGCRRQDFPRETEHLLLSVAANQATIGLQSAQQLSEQRRVAKELDERVERRTAELAAMNEELRRQIFERERAEENARDQEVLLRQLIDSVAAEVTLCTPEGETVVVNRFCLELTGRPFEDHQDWATGDPLYHPDDLPLVKEGWARAVAGGGPYEVEVRVHRADGTYRWVHSHGFPIRDANGRIFRWCTLHLDITRRKQAEEAQTASERKLDLVINTVPGLIWSARPDGDAEFFNRHYIDYVGRSSEQMQNAGWTQQIHPDDRQALAEAWREMMITRQAGEAEARLRRFDGEYRWFLFRINPLLDEAGTIMQWFGVNIDIEDRKRAEEALRTSERNLRRLTETIPQMLWSATPDGSIDYCNGRLLEYTGFVMADTLGNGWTRLLHPDDVELAARTWQACVLSGEPFQVEVRIFHAVDHSYRWCLTNALPLRDEEGRILKWHGTCIDMHDWKQAQDELRETQMELAHMTRMTTMGQLTASIAHELNQPLAGIITNASTCLRMLAGDPPNVSGARETARRTIRDGNRASDVITRLRDLFKKRNTVLEAVDMNTVAQEVIALTSSELQRSDVSLRMDLANDLPFVTGDRVQLQQVILNLILNAAEAMLAVEDREKELTIITRREEPGQVRLAVKDAGAGFDPAMIEKLFNPFYTTKSNGMGIGLSVSRSIIENHQGHLGAELNDGPGATFWFSVPCGPDSGVDSSDFSRFGAARAARAMGKA